ncbi:histidine kinase [Olsenella sp. YH-ols2217]|uniref:Histidine kinase n=1 Tax=Kribbibacterium absianum TaxID=3044210 RepID=A0ABT6ZJ76_9ACTN|nr:MULTISPECIES: histidine kinase [unclassified Olsenella]MDJ1122672.1 histidine kinase [Olsenella sp. YH-ols2216]MDJ1129110.1 histidine kinase [Olsenella sp. YH-ols2217]
MPRKRRSRSERFVLVIFWLCVLTMGALLAWGISEREPVVVVIAGVGIAVVILAGAQGAPDSLRSQATERTLRTASSTLDYLRHGLEPEGCRAVCQLLLPETNAMSIAITDHEKVIAYVGEYAEEFPAGMPVRTQATKEVLESGRMQTFSLMDPVDADAMGAMGPADRLRMMGFMPAGIVVPLIVKEETIGTLKFYYHNFREADRTQTALARGFGELLSTQLSLYELEHQAQLTAQAEVKALQAQINPHFLFNTLNTIAALIRTDPMRARTLLREFATFYRQTLENSSESLIPLEREMEQTRRYLTFEYARFGEDRIAEQERVEEGCEDVLVPAFLIQPIVENAVRHAMREEGVLHIDIHVTREGDDILIAVADDGVGMTPEEVERLTSKASGVSHEEKGTGVALRNVAQRLERQFAPGSGLEVMSREGEGTVITLHLNGATKGLVDEGL